MNIDQIRQDFERVEAISIPKQRGSMEVWYDLQAATEWSVKAQMALEGVFPPAHTALKRWHAVLQGAQGQQSWRLREPNIYEPLRAIFSAALERVRSGELTSLREGARAETVMELLDQADLLRKANELIAATVIAGGALETHLLHLCQKNAITWTGDGSINKYNDAIAAAANAGTVEVYNATRVKDVKAWGGRRNDAAHDPLNYKPAAQAVEVMIAGIRGFVSETT